MTKPPYPWFRWSLGELFYWITNTCLLCAILKTEGPWPLLPGAAMMVLVLYKLWTSPNPYRTNDHRF